MTSSSTSTRLNDFDKPKPSKASRLVIMLEIWPKPSCQLVGWSLHINPMPIASASTRLIDFDKPKPSKASRLVIMLEIWPKPSCQLVGWSLHINPMPIANLALIKCILCRFHSLINQLLQISRIQQFNVLDKPCFTSLKLFSQPPICHHLQQKTPNLWIYEMEVSQCTRIKRQRCRS